MACIPTPAVAPRVARGVDDSSPDSAAVESIGRNLVFAGNVILCPFPESATFFGHAPLATVSRCASRCFVVGVSR